MKRIDFAEKVIIILGLLAEAMAILLIFAMLSSCKVKKQEEIKRSEKTEVLLNVKTGETKSDSLVNVVRNIVIDEMTREFYAWVEIFKYSEPDSEGNQYVTHKATVNITDKSKTNKQSETVDSTINNSISTKTAEDNSKIKTEIKNESKVKNEMDSKGWINFAVILGIGFLIGLAAIIYNKFK